MQDCFLISLQLFSCMETTSQCLCRCLIHLHQYQLQSPVSYNGNNCSTCMYITIIRLIIFSLSLSLSQGAGDELPLGFESVLKETVNVMLLQSHNIDIQTYGLSFITLSLIDGKKKGNGRMICG